MACIIPIKVDIFENSCKHLRKVCLQIQNILKKYYFEKLTLIYISVEFSKDVKHENARSLVLPKPSFSWDDEESGNSLKITFYFYV